MQAAMSLLAPRPAGPLPARFAHETEPVKLRLQAFLTVRDAQRRVAAVRLEDEPDLWRLMGEQIQLNEDPHDAARRVAKSWFATPLSPKLVDVQSYPANGPDDDRWYLIFVFEAAAPANLQGTPDTLELKWLSRGETPGKWYSDHSSVFARLSP